MDHLPLPKDPIVGTLEIPFVSDVSYDDGDFFSYPERKGWEIETYDVELNFYREGVKQSDEREVAAFVQTWLYFGLLSTALRSIIDMNKFRKSNVDGTVALSSNALTPLLGEWSIQMTDADLDQIICLEWLNLISKMLASTSSILQQQFSDTRRNNTGSSVLLDKVYLGIAVLGETLAQAVWDIRAQREMPFEKSFLSWRTPGNRLVAAILQQMRQSGWCPSRLKYFDLAEFASIGQLWYNANLLPPSVYDKHTDCTVKECLSLQVDLQQYKPLHQKERCDCDFVGPIINEVIEVFSTDRTPLMEYISDIQGRGGQLKTSTIDDTECFFAISHVWADGRGNKTSNLLPRCVVAHAQDCVTIAAQQSSYGAHVPFWMDTLCLPIAPRDLRQRAIASMREPFTKATAVLVLDTYLLGLKAAEMSSLEILARVQASNWMTRLWTFSEGRLARKVLFRFQDRTVDLSSCAEAYFTRPRIPVKMDSDVWFSLLNGYTASRIMPEDYVDGSILGIKAALNSRTTSWKADEALCLAGLLNLDLLPIAKAPEHEKMSVFWRSLTEVPVGFLFMDTLQKLNGRGLRWAPRTLMCELDLPTGATAGAAELHFVPARPTENGLVVKLPTLFLPKTEPTSESCNIKKKVVEYCLGCGTTSSHAGFVLQNQEGLWYDCWALHQWHEQVSMPDLSTHDLAITLIWPPPKSTPAHGKAHTKFRPIVPGILIAYPRDAKSVDIRPAKALVHVAVSVSLFQHFRNAVFKCGEELWEKHSEEIETLSENREVLVYAFEQWITEDYLDLEQLLRETNAHVIAAGKDFPLVVDQIWLVAKCLADLVEFGEQYKIETASGITAWCVD